MLAQIQKKDLRCVTLESPKKLYDNLLLNIYENFGEKEKDVFEFSFRSDLPNPVLECRNPLKWFRSLEQRGKLSWTDVNSLVDFLKEASLYALLSEARHYQARIRVIGFFQKHLQANLPELCLDDKFNEKWSSEQNLPKRYLRRCQELLRGTWMNCDVSANHLRSLFSKGVVLLVKSCSPMPSSNGLQAASLKLLCLADLFYKRFKEMIVYDKELLNIKPLPSGKFAARDNRRRMPVSQRRRSSVPAEVQKEVSHRRGSREVFQFHLRLCLPFLLGLFTIFLVLEAVNGNNDNTLSGDLSD